MTALTVFDMLLLSQASGHTAEEEAEEWDESMHSVPSDASAWNANDDKNLYCFVQLMHTEQRCGTWFLPVKLQAAQFTAG